MTITFSKDDHSLNSDHITSLLDSNPVAVILKESRFNFIFDKHINAIKFIHYFVFRIENKSELEEFLIKNSFIRMYPKYNSLKTTDNYKYYFKCNIEIIII